MMPLSPTMTLAGERDDGLYTVTIETRDLSVALNLAARAVYERLGEHPTHFLAGWKSYAQLILTSPQANALGMQPLERGYTDTLWFMGRPVYLDPTREHFIAAVPHFRRIVGNPMPEGSVWQP